MSDASIGDLIITAVAGLGLLWLAAYSLIRPDSHSFTRLFCAYLERWSFLSVRSSLILLVTVSFVITLMASVPLLERIF